MVTTARDFTHRANVPFIFEVTVYKSGLPYDLTGHVATMQVRRYEGDPAAAQASLVMAAEGSQGICFKTAHATSCVIRVQINEATLQAFTGLSATGDVTHYEYDLVLADAGGVQQIIMAGDFDLSKGVTA